MKVAEIINETNGYQILSYERDTAELSGTSKKGYINAKYDDLVKLFGKPQNHTQDDQSDVNYVWDLHIKYKDPLNDDHMKHEDDHHITDVSIYDYRHDNDSRYVNPATINAWIVGAKTREEAVVLDDLLRQKGVIK